MTHIEQMIQDMCPNGVEFKTLGEVCEILDAKRKPVTKSQRASGEYPYYGANGIQDYVNEYIFDGTFLLIGEDGSVINKDKSPVINWAEGKIWVNNHAHILSEKKDIVLLRFLYYYLQTIDVSDLVWGTPPKLNQQNLRSIPIPLPPIEIQKKIVECLDKFSALAAELQAELQKRRQQYEYYRTRLLTPPQNISSDDSTDERNWEWKTLEEIFEMRGGYTPSKNNPKFWEGGDIPWFRMEDIRQNGRILKDSILHVSKEAVKGKGLFEKDSFILATSATIGEHALLTTDALTNQRFTNLKVREQYKSQFYTKFIYYYMFKVDEFCKSHTNVSGFESVDMEALKKMPVPIPPIQDQKRIADTLDKFEALTTSLSDGIPAEQAAQQKRYEYYRDLLLTF